MQRSQNCFVKILRSSNKRSKRLQVKDDHRHLFSIESALKRKLAYLSSKIKIVNTQTRIIDNKEARENFKIGSTAQKCSIKDITPREQNPERIAIPTPTKIIRMSKKFMIDSSVYRKGPVIGHRTLNPKDRPNSHSTRIQIVIRNVRKLCAILLHQRSCCFFLTRT